MTLFTGAGVAMVTPFADGKIDFPRLGQLIDWQISSGIDAIVSCGTTGEASTLTDKEHIDTVRFTVERVAGRVPVIAGSGSNDTRHALEKSKALEAVGADGLLIVTPYYNKCTQKGLITHYTTIADQVEIPIILYSVAGRTGVNISPFAVSELSLHPNICGIKEASGNLSQVVEIARLVTDEFALYSGNDDQVVPMLALGGSGVISTVANLIPAEVHRMIDAYLKGDTAAAAQMQLAQKPLIDSIFTEVNPVPVKAALAEIGKILLEYRLPLCPPEAATMDRIRKELIAWGLLLEEQR